MIRNFDQLLKKAKSKEQKTVAVAGAVDDTVLKTIKLSQEAGLVQTVLVGDKNKIKNLAADIGLDISCMEIIHELNPKQIARAAVDLAVQK